MAALSLLSLFLTSQLSIATPVRRHDPLPGGWTPQGCYTDSINPRTLSGATTSSLNMTTEDCVGFCDANSFIFAGTEFGKECYCGNFTAPSSAITDDSLCSIACGGDATEICGGEFALSLLWNGVPPPDPVTVPAVGNWVSLGCYSDNVDGRALTAGPMVLDAPNTIEVCTQKCFDSGFPFSGTEFAGECYCGNEIGNGGAPAAATDCNMVCTGNPLEFCGGPNRLNVYNYTGDDLPTQPGGGDGGGNTPPPPEPVTSGLPTTWAYQACFVDNANGRVFENAQPAGATNTIESCIAACDGLNFTVAGTEFGDECYCGNRLVNGAAPAAEADCSMGCAGNATEACGGPNRLSVYASTAEVVIVPVPTAQTTDLPDGWSYAGCFSDDKGNDGRVLPLQIILGNNSAPNCIDACLAADPTTTAAGAEFGDECYCGTIEDITTNNSTQRPESECNVVCSGDAASLCGGGFRLQMYTLAAAA